MDRGAWQATGHWVTESWTRLSGLNNHHHKGAAEQAAPHLCLPQRALLLPLHFDIMKLQDALGLSPLNFLSSSF